jgi:hypothetical protein
MPFLSGVVEKVFSKEKPEPDQFGNGFRHAMRIEGHDFWIGLGDGKKAEVTVKDGKSFRALTEGSKVEFLYTERAGNNGNVFRDAKKTGIKVLEWGEGSNQASQHAPPSRGQAASAAAAPASKPASASAARTGASGGSGGTDWVRKDAGAAASASIDKAIRYLTATGLLDGMVADYDDILKVAREMNRLTTTLLEEILNGGIKVETPAPVAQVETPPTPKAAAKKAAPAPVKTWEEEDSEVPF